MTAFNEQLKKMREQISKEYEAKLGETFQEIEQYKKEMENLRHDNEMKLGTRV